MEKKMLEAGFGEADVSPGGPTMVAGQYYKRYAPETRDPLRAVALALRPAGSDELVFWVSIDALQTIRAATVAAGKLLAEKIPGFLPERLICCTTHNHTTPYLFYTELEQTWEDELVRSGVPDDYVDADKYLNDIFVPGIVEACMKAYHNLAPSGISHVLGNATIGHCRRIHFRDGSAQMFGNTNDYNFDCLEGPSDSRVNLMYVYDSEKKLKGLMINVPCPSQCFTRKEFVSADFFGIFRELLNKNLGYELPVVTTVGAAGDMFPQDYLRRNRGEPDMRDIEGATELAKRLLNCFEYNSKTAAEDIETELCFSHEHVKLALPLRTVSAREVAEAKEICDGYLKSVDGDISRLGQKAATMYTAYNGTLLRATLQNKCSLMDADIHIMRIGDTAVATNPFELFSVYGMRMIARSKAANTLSVQLTDDYMGYLPTKLAAAGGGYSTMVSSTIIGAEGGELLTESTIRMINELFDNRL